MPQVIPILIPVAVALATGASLGTVIIGTVVSVGLSLLARQLTPKAASPTLGDPSSATINGARSVPVRQPLPPRRFVYGRARIGGAIFWLENSNPHLYTGVALSDGVIDAVEAVYVGATAVPLDGSGNAVAGTAYAGKFSAEIALGLSTQAASAQLLAAFPTMVDSNFSQRGVARIVYKMDWGADAQEHNVLWGNSVSPTAVMRGMKVFDPRDGAQSSSDPSTWTYSDNPALCFAHAVSNMWLSPVAHANIDYTTVATAANDCDATVLYAGVNEKIFTFAGVFESGKDTASQLTEMLGSFGGTVAYANGKLSLYTDKARASVWTVTDADVVDFGEYTHGPQWRDTPNATKASYYDADGAGVVQLTTPYELTADIAANGRRELAIQAAYTPRSHSAQILAYRELQKARDGRALSLTVNDAGLALVPSDVITIASVAAPFLNGDFEVVQIDMTTVGCILRLRGYTSAAYTDPTTYLV